MTLLHDSVMTKVASLWTIEDLSAQVSVALAEGYQGQDSRRVREVPDLRTIRYYTTIGLLDRPLEIRGRTAMYGERHLLQLVAIKRLQSRGLTLREVQQKLLGLSDAKLRTLARIPSEAGCPSSTARADAISGGTERDFWKAAAPVDVLSPAEESAPPTSFLSSSVMASRNLPRLETPDLDVPASFDVEPSTQPLRTLTGLPLTEGVVLLVEASYEPDDDDMESIRIAAEPLLKLLEIRRLVRPRTERKRS